MIAGVQSVITADANITKIYAGTALLWERPAVTAPVPVAWWKMETLSGGNTVLDEMNGHHGVAAVTTNLSVQTGMWGSAVQKQVDANTCFVVPHHASLGNGPSLTLATWLYPIAFLNCDVVTKYNSGQDGWDLVMTSSTNATPSRIGFRLSKQTHGDTYRVLNTSALAANTWYFVVVTYDGQTIRLYLNGVENATLATTVGIAANTAPLRLGANFGGGNYRGRFDETRLYNQVLTPAQILEMYNSNALSTPAEPTAWDDTLLWSNTKTWAD